jgi:ABC-type branched-subunit amino acid transport system substrate-binding protein
MKFMQDFMPEACAKWANKLVVPYENLSRADRRALDKHMPTCPGCRAAHDEYDLIKRILNTPDPDKEVRPKKSFQELVAAHQGYANTHEAQQEQQKATLFFAEYRQALLPRIRRSSYMPVWIAATLMLIFILLSGAFALLIQRGSTPTSAPMKGINVQKGISVQTLADGESIGISDGRFAFDTNRPDGNLKVQAGSRFRSGDRNEAKVLWQQAVQQEPNDAEAQIYLENVRVLDSERPYITIVVGTILTGNTGDPRPGIDNLQGAYLAQKEFNDGFKLPGGVLVRLLVANSGSANESTAKQIAEQITQAASVDKTIVGVMGWPLSQSTLNAVTILANAHLPLVSETASTDALTGLSPYFFRVVSSNKSQGVALARYAEQTQHAKRVAVFVDSTNSYSSDLARDFTQQFHNSIVATEQYTVGNQGRGQLLGLLQDALQHNPDAIFFSGYANDVSVILTDLPTSGPFANIQVLGGDGFYELEGYSPSAHPKLGRLHFTAYAYPDEWDIAGLGAQKPAFFAEYINAYGSNQKLGEYGFTRATDNVILSYDATLSLLTGSNIALKEKQGNKMLTGDDVRQALVKITGAQALQGVSGQLAFGPDGNPINKALVMLRFDASGQIHEDNPPQGCFQVEQCS